MSRIEKDNTNNIMEHLLNLSKNNNGGWTEESINKLMKKEGSNNKLTLQTLSKTISNGWMEEELDHVIYEGKSELDSIVEYHADVDRGIITDNKDNDILKKKVPPKTITMTDGDGSNGGEAVSSSVVAEEITTSKIVIKKETDIISQALLAERKERKVQKAKEHELKRKEHRDKHQIRHGGGRKKKGLGVRMWKNVVSWYQISETDAVAAVVEGGKGGEEKESQDSEELQHGNDNDDNDDALKSSSLSSSESESTSIEDDFEPRILRLPINNNNANDMSSNTVHVVEFYAPWCPHCQHFAPTYAAMARSIRRRLIGDNIHIVFTAVSCTLHPEICSTYDVSSYPTMMGWKLEDVIVGDGSGKPHVEGEGNGLGEGQNEGEGNAVRYAYLPPPGIDLGGSFTTTDKVASLLNLALTEGDEDDKKYNKNGGGGEGEGGEEGPLGNGSSNDWYSDSKDERHHQAEKVIAAQEAAQYRKERTGVHVNQRIILGNAASSLVFALRSGAHRVGGSNDITGEGGVSRSKVLRTFLELVDVASPLGWEGRGLARVLLGKSSQMSLLPLLPPYQLELEVDSTKKKKKKKKEKTAAADGAQSDVVSPIDKGGKVLLRAIDVYVKNRATSIAWGDLGTGDDLGIGDLERNNNNRKLFNDAEKKKNSTILFNNKINKNDGPGFFHRFLKRRSTTTTTSIINVRSEIVSNAPIVRWNEACAPSDHLSSSIVDGYPCGLWELFHVLSVGRNPDNHKYDGSLYPFTSKGVAKTIRDFIEIFFGCEVCRTNFIKEYDQCAYGVCNLSDENNSNSNSNSNNKGDDSSTALWLWRMHNSVTTRRMKEAAWRGRRNATEKEIDAAQFPDVTSCPDCRVVIRDGDSDIHDVAGGIEEGRLPLSIGERVDPTVTTTILKIIKIKEPSWNQAAVNEFLVKRYRFSEETMPLPLPVVNGIRVLPGGTAKVNLTSWGIVLSIIVFLALLDFAFPFRKFSVAVLMGRRSRIGESRGQRRGKRGGKMQERERWMIYLSSRLGWRQRWHSKRN